MNNGVDWKVSFKNILLNGLLAARMKTPVSVSAISVLILAAFASDASNASETNRPTSTAPMHGATTGELNLSRSTTDIVQLTQAGMDENVIFSFIANSGIFQLSAVQVVYLNDLGVSSRIIQAMLAHDGQRLGDLATNATVSTIQPESATEAPGAKSTSPSMVVTNIANVAGTLPVESRPVDQKIAAADKLSPAAIPSTKKLLYRVREPYPVELTAPIVLLDAPTF